MKVNEENPGTMIPLCFALLLIMVGVVLAIAVALPN